MGAASTPGNQSVLGAAGARGQTDFGLQDSEGFRNQAGSLLASRPLKAKDSFQTSCSAARKFLVIIPEAAQNYGLKTSEEELGEDLNLFTRTSAFNCSLREQRR